MYPYLPKDIVTLDTKTPPELHALNYMHQMIGSLRRYPPRSLVSCRILSVPTYLSIGR